MDLLVYPENDRWVARIGARSYRCAIGRGGVRPAVEKREGDGATPLGRWPLRRLLFRPDRVEAPQTALPSAPLSQRDGWCDDPERGEYNQPVNLPFPGHHETLWRQDGLYDLLVVLGHNDDPPRPGNGSAIFLHCAHDDYAPTEGCVALRRADLEEVLSQLQLGDAVEVLAEAPAE